ARRRGRCAHRLPAPASGSRRRGRSRKRRPARPGTPAPARGRRRLRRRRTRAGARKDPVGLPRRLRAGRAHAACARHRADGRGRDRDGAAARRHRQPPAGGRGRGARGRSGGAARPLGGGPHRPPARPCPRCLRPRADPPSGRGPRGPAVARLRADVGGRAPVGDGQARVAEVAGLLDRSELVLTDDQAAGAGAAFVGALTILLREGIEALLLVIAMVAFLRKANRTDAMPYVHAGWIGALLAGFATWFAATSLVAISGAGREVTEGIAALVAVVVLVSVGIWMHGKGQADAWQRYIREKLSHALSRGSSWFLFGLAFLIVYREAFETVLFYAALWSQGNHSAVLAGAAVATVALAVVGWAMLRFSKRLPFGTFFKASAVLIAVLAVVLAGKGVAALQEAGWVSMTLVPVPRVDLL